MCQGFPSYALGVTILKIESTLASFGGEGTKPAVQVLGSMHVIKGPEPSAELHTKQYSRYNPRYQIKFAALRGMSLMPTSQQA